MGQLNIPSHFVVDKHDNVLVADSSNNRVQLLSPALNYLDDIVIPGHQLMEPFTLHFDEQNRRVYIGEWGGGRMFVFYFEISDDI